MIRTSVSLLLAVLVSSSYAHAAALSQLKALAGTASFSAIFDGGTERPALTAGVMTATRSQTLDLRRLAQAKKLLSHGTELPDGGPILPFTFRHGAAAVTAPSAGLEGFLYAERDIAQTYGRQAVAHHLSDYFRYLDALLAPVAWAADAREQMQAIERSSDGPRAKYERLMAFIEDYTNGLRAQVAASDASAWMREARIYEIFPRAYNLDGKRAARDRWEARSSGRFFADFGAADLRDIRAKNFDTVWVMGIFPIGERGRTGTGGGSPYSIRDHAGIHPDLGTPEEFRGFVRRAHAEGLRVIIDFVPNHTSLDSKLLNEDPRFFVHRPAGPGAPPDGFFAHTDKNTGAKLWIRHGGYLAYGSVSPWIDTAQIDYSNPLLRRRMIDIVAGWVERCGVDGFRLDMTHLVTNDVFARTWGKRMPKREFLEELITEVKSRYPGTGFLGEAYDKWDTLSETGFDLLYGKNNMDRPGGHHGWYDALESRDAGWIRAAIKRAAFLNWQQGGTDMMSFVGNHDEASPQRAFREWTKGASFLTLLMPGGLLFYGSQEIGFDRPNLASEPKSLPFSVPVQVDWASADPDLTKFHNDTFALARRIHTQLGEAEIEPLDPLGDQGWAGYLLVGREGAAAVVANPSGRTVEVRFSRLGIEHRTSLPPYGYSLLPL